jgi:trimeric autotransporter adhesin
LQTFSRLLKKSRNIEARKTNLSRMLFHHQSRRRLSAIFLQLQSLKRFSRFNFGFLSGFLSDPRVFNQETQTFSTSTSSSSPSFATVSSVSAGDIITVNLNTSSSSSSSTSSTSSSSTSSFSNATPYSLVRFERGAVGLVIDVKKNGTLRVALVAGAQPNPGEAALFSADGTISTFGKGKQGIDQLTTTTTTTSDNGSNSSIDGVDSIKPSLSSSPVLNSTITSASLVVDVNRRGREFCGRVVDCLGRPIDGKGPLSSSNSTTTSIDDELHNYDERGSNSTENISSSSLLSSSSSSGSMTNVPLFFRNSPSIVSRSRINKTLTTGYKAIDGFNPISLGTGNVITGERNSGKQKTVLEIISTLSKKIDRAALASSASNNQDQQEYIDDELNDEIKNPSAIVYVLTGCSVSAAKNAVKSLRDSGALHNTAVIVSTANEPCGAQYMSIFTGLALGESIRDSGGRALVIVDNLTRLFVSARRVAGESTLATSSSSLASPVVSQTVGALFDRAAQLSESNGGGSLTVLSLMDTPPSMSNSMINDNISNSAGESLLSSSSMTGRGMSPGSHGLSGSTRLGGKSLDTSLFDYTRSLADTIIEFSSTGHHRSSGSLIPIDFYLLSMTSRSHRSQGKGFQLASRNSREVLCELREISKNVAIAQSVGVSMESEFDAAISMLTKAKLLVLPTTSLLNEVLAENTIDGEDEEVERIGGGGLSEKVVKLTIEGIPSSSSTSSSSSSSTLTSITKRMYSTSSSSSFFKRSYSTSSALFSKDDPFSTITNTKSSSSSSSSPDKTIDKLVNKLDSAQLRTLLAVSGSRLRKSAAAVAAQANIAHTRPPSSQASSSTTTPLIDVAVKAARRAKIDVDVDGSLDTTTARSKEGEEEGGRSSNSKSNSRSAEFSFSALYGKRSPSSAVNQQTTTSPLSSSVSSSSSIRSKPPPPVSVAAAVIEDEEVIEGEAFHETLKRLEEKEKKGLASSSTSSTTSPSSPSTTAISNDSRDSTLSSAARGTRKFSTFARQSRAFSTTSSSLSSSSSSLPSSFRKLQLPPQVFADAVIKPVSKTAKESSDNQDPSSSFSSSSSVLSTWEDSPIRGDRKRTFLVLFCIANGYLARVPLKRVFEFEAGLYTLLTRLPPPNRHRKESVKNSSSSSTSSSSSPHMSLLDKVIERGAGNDLFLLNTSRTIHQSLKALELRRIILNARIAKEESKKREEEAILAEKKRKEEKNARGSTGGSTFASFFFGGGRGASSSSTTTPPPSFPPPSASSSSNGTSLDTLPPSSPTSSFSSSSSSSSFSFDDLIEGGSIAPEGIQAIHRLLEISSSSMTNQTHVSSVPPSDSINKNKREEEGIDGTTIKKDLFINTKDQDITYNEEMIDDIACLAALHVSVASFIKIVFEDEK